MQRILIVLAVGLLTVGCATVKDIGVHLGITGPIASNKNKPSIVETPPKVTLPQESLPPLPVTELTPEQKQKTLRDSVVGEYEIKVISDGATKRVFLKNGIVENYEAGKKRDDYKWKIVNKGLHVKGNLGTVFIYRINKDKSITYIAYISDGKRIDLPEIAQEQYTYIKIK